MIPWLKNHTGESTSAPAVDVSFDATQAQLAHGACASAVLPARTIFADAAARVNDADRRTAISTGGVGVSGAPGGEKDEVCANAGIAKVAEQLK